MANSHRISILGKFAVTCGDRTLLISSAHARGLLTYMIAQPERVFDRLHLAQLLWPESPDRAHARHSLSQTLYSLKRLLNEVVWREDGSSIGIDTKSIDSDLWDLQRAMRLEQVENVCDLLSATVPKIRVDGCGREIEEWAEEFSSALADAVDAWRRTKYERLVLDGDVEAASRLRRLLRESECESRYVAALEATLPSSDRVFSAVSDRVPFVGRRKELQQLAASLDASSDHWTTQLVLGRPGIGKSRLGDRFVRQAALRGWRVLSARCYESQSRRPFSVLSALLGSSDLRADAELLSPIWRAAVRTIAPHLDAGVIDHLPSLDESGSRLRLFTGVAELLSTAAAKSPIIVFVDDVQWIDRSSADCIHHCATRRSDTPIFLLCTTRSTEPRPSWIDELRPARDVLLSGLAAGEVDEILAHAESRSALPSGIREQFRGEDSPYRIVSLLDYAIRGTGAAHDASILRHLSGIARELAAALAVLGLPIRVDEAANLYGTPLPTLAETVSELCDTGLLSEHEGVLAFRHDLAREAARSSLTVEEGTRAHLRAATYLARAHPQDLASIAAHLEVAGDRAAACDAALLAADQCESAFAPTEAVECLRLARRTSTGLTQQVDIAARLARCLTASDRWSEASAILRNADDVLGLSGEPITSPVRARIRAELALAVSGADRRPTAETLAEIGAQLSNPALSNDLELRGRLAVVACQSAYQTLDEVQIRTQLNAIREISQQSDGKHCGHTFAYTLRALGGRRAALTESWNRLRRANEMGRVDDRIGAMQHYGCMLVFNARLDEAEQVYSDVFALIAATGAVSHAHSATINASVLLQEQARLSEARERFHGWIDVQGVHATVGALDLMNLATIEYEDRNDAECGRLCKALINLPHASVAEQSQAHALLGLNALASDSTGAESHHAALITILPKRIAFAGDPSYILGFLARYRAHTGAVADALDLLDAYSRRAARSDVLCYWRIRLERAYIAAGSGSRLDLAELHAIRRSAHAAGASLVETRAERYLTELE